MARIPIAAVLTGEAAALVSVVAELPGADLEQPSSCPPWTVAELVSHVVVSAGRIRTALAGPDAEGGRLIGTAEYYRPGERFSAAVNSSRIETASRLAATLATPAALAAELDRVSRDAAGLMAAAPEGRTIRTRHGDRILLTDFAVTRVAELGLHGLDIAISLGRAPWLTPPAAAMLDELLMPAGAPPRLRGRLGPDQVSLIAKLTGRMPVTGPEETLLREAGIPRLTLG